MINWIEWNGGECPVPIGTLVDVKHRDGEYVYSVPAGIVVAGSHAKIWHHIGGGGDIICYRTHEKKQVLTTWSTVEAITNWNPTKVTV